MGRILSALSIPGDSSRDPTNDPLFGGHVANHLKGHVNAPSQKGHQQNCQVGDNFKFHLKINLSQMHSTWDGFLFVGCKVDYSQP